MRVGILQQSFVKALTLVRRVGGEFTVIVGYGRCDVFVLIMQALVLESMAHGVRFEA